MPIFLALVALFTAISAIGAETVECRAASFAGIEECLERPEASDPATILDVIITEDLVLGDREHLLLDGRAGLVLRGPDDRVVTVSESAARLEADGGNNRYMITVSGGSDVEVRGLRIIDHQPNELASRCRAGGHPTLPNRWEKGPCDPPLWVGGGVSSFRLSDVEIDSGKPILLELRNASDVFIDRSRFIGGSVFGILFDRNSDHRNIIITNSEFRDIGANAIVVHNASGVVIRGNHFIDNHWDRQFLQCGETGVEPCTGGQLLVRDHRDRPVADVFILDNVVTQTDPRADSATGIEIGNADRADLTGIYIMGNTVTNLGRPGIQVHAGRLPGGHDVVVAFNRVRGNGIYLDDGGRGDQITINENTGVAVYGNAAVSAGFSSGNLPQ